MARNRRKTSLGCLFWIAFILLVVVLFFLNKDNIAFVLEKTNAREILFNNKKVETVSSPDSLSPETMKKQEDEKEQEKKAEDARKAAEAEKKQKAEEARKAQEQAKKEEEKKKAITNAKKHGENKKPAKASASATASKKKTPKKKPQKKKNIQVAKTQTRKAKLFFLSIDSDGEITRRECIRLVKKTDSPLCTALETLFNGPLQAEAKNNVRSFIPRGTRVLGASVKNGLATINLSEEFEFNQNGIEGYLAQLAQVVFTATAFPTVDAVQILIEGKKKDYLGSEGVWIGSPLSRSKF